MSVRAAALCALAACGTAARPPPQTAAADDGLLVEPRSVEAFLLVRWRGARVGDARERIEQDDDGLRLFHEERVVVLRGGVRVQTESEVAVEASDDLAPRALRFQQRVNGHSAEAGAFRVDGGWQTEPPGPLLPAAALPAPWVPVLVARRGLDHFDGDVIVPGVPVTLAHLTLQRAGEPGHFAARWRTEGGTIDSELTIDRDGATLRASSGDVVVERASIEATLDPFTPLDVVVASAIPVAGRRRPGPMVELDLTDVAAAPPPPLPGQQILAEGNRWVVVLRDGAWGAPAAPAAAATADPDAPLAATAAAVLRESGARTGRERVAALLAYADRAVADDLAAPPAAGTAAFPARGDCTTHALLFVGLATAANIPARVVTGYRLDGDRLVRHRWALVALDGRWLAVDPTFGELPAAAGHLALAAHGPSAAELAVVDETAFAGLASARAMLR